MPLRAAAREARGRTRRTPRDRCGLRPLDEPL